jgi:hypothetical protein
VVNSTLRQAGRFSSPTILILTALCFLLPFASVACAPGGFGEAAAGGSVRYTGVTLIVGGQPVVDPPGKVRPPEQQRDERLPPQPMAAVALILIVAALVVAIANRVPRGRRGGVALLAGAAAAALVVNQALVIGELKVRLLQQLVEPLPEGKVLDDFVRTGPGFFYAMLMLIIVVVGNAIGWYQVRRRAELMTVTGGG